MHLIIGNKNYSSWSFRPWIAMRTKEIEFSEALVPFDFEAGNPEIAKLSPTGRVPVLVDGDLTIPESLAILEYLADKFPDKGFWPSDIKVRAMARAISHEMHGGFSGLRNECPMNMRRKIGAIEVSEPVEKDVARIESIWEQALQASGGPFLYGEFSNADAMFAPVVNRLEVYALSTHPSVTAYSETMKNTPAWQEWESAGKAEPWIVDVDEA